MRPPAQRNRCHEQTKSASQQRTAEAHQQALTRDSAPLSHGAGTDQAHQGDGVSAPGNDGGEGIRRHDRTHVHGNRNECAGDQHQCQLHGVPAADVVGRDQRHQGRRSLDQCDAERGTEGRDDQAGAMTGEFAEHGGHRSTQSIDRASTGEMRVARRTGTCAAPKVSAAAATTRAASRGHGTEGHTSTGPSFSWPSRDCAPAHP